MTKERPGEPHLKKHGTGLHMMGVHGPKHSTGVMNGGERARRWTTTWTTWPRCRTCASS